MPLTAHRRAVASPHAVRSFLSPLRHAFAALALGVTVLAWSGAIAAVPSPPTEITAVDAENDRGGGVTVRWKSAPADSAVVTGYVVERAPSADGPWAATDTVSAGSTEKRLENLANGTPVFVRVRALGADGVSAPSAPASASPHGDWFNSTRVSVFVILILFFAFVMFFITSAQAGKPLFVRRIPGIDAIEEAIGRATEMGRSVLYVPGINDIDDIQTMASLTILESVAKMTAKYETPIVVPTNYPVVFTLAQEMVKNGYMAAGRPDAYDPDSVRYVTTEQFAYVAAVNGIMLRDKPAANIYLGSFFAESLLLAETGFQTKAIQVAGTAQVAQLPFFVVACDYTLIGEELYAASAYLSREPRLLGSLKGSDLMKVLLIAIIVIGCILETAGIHGFTQWMTTQ
jgi:hypothetical protein